MLSLPDLEETYDLLAEAVDRAPAAQRELMLAKLALLLAHELGDRARVAALVEAALADLV
jgi:putative Ca2+/H+ antiporter (TMEM165/GDT1 family)